MIALIGATLPATSDEDAGAAQPSGNRPAVSDRHDRVLFGSVELAEVSIFAGSGVKYSLSGDIEAPGPIALLMTNLGATRERWQAPDGVVAHVPRMTQITRAYFGHQGNTLLGFVTLAAGGEIIRAQALGEDALPRWQASRIGATFLGELWREAPLPGQEGPVARAYLFHASLMAGTAMPSVWGRLAGGIAIGESVFAGPELSAYHEPGYSEWRIGAHLTGARLGPLRLRLAGGVVIPDGGRSDIYLGLQAHMLR